MPPRFMFDLSKIDLTQVAIDKETICQMNPQRYEMQQLDAVVWYNKEKYFALGYKDVTEDEFWIRGHIPDRPLMPGVIMIESAAQLSSVIMKYVYNFPGFMGFAGINKAKFRQPVEPGQRLYILAHITKFHPRKYTCLAQGVVDGKMVFETELSGLKV